MIMHFSGTGNSRYAAERISAKLGDELYDMNTAIRTGSVSAVETGKKLIIAAPTYAWRLPAVVSRWISETELTGAEDVWFVMTCGSETGNSAKYNKALCDAKGLKYMGTYQIVMPENYIAMFDAPDVDKAKRIVAAAEPEIDKAAGFIAGDSPFPAPRCNPYDMLMSSVANSIFYRFAVKTDAFASDGKCTGCGLCRQKCPLNNISIKDGRPIWGKHCTHCMACICYCPQEAIEYGKKSAGKPRYHIEAIVK